MKIWSVVYQDHEDEEYTVNESYVLGVYTSKDEAYLAAKQVCASQAKACGTKPEESTDGWFTRNKKGDWSESWSVKEHDLEVPAEKAPKVEISKADFLLIIIGLGLSYPFDPYDDKLKAGHLCHRLQDIFDSM